MIAFIILLVLFILTCILYSKNKCKSCINCNGCKKDRQN